MINSLVVKTRYPEFSNFEDDFVEILIAEGILEIESCYDKIFLEDEAKADLLLLKYIAWLLSDALNKQNSGGDGIGNLTGESLGKESVSYGEGGNGLFETNNTYYNNYLEFAKNLGCVESLKVIIFGDCENENII